MTSCGASLGKSFFPSGHGLPRRGEGRLPAVRGHRGSLDPGVGVRLVVVHDEEDVMAAVHQGGHRLEPDVDRAAVAGHDDDVRQFALVLPLADHDVVGRLDAGGDGPAVRDLAVRPGHGERGAHVAAVRHVHATRGAEEDRVGARRLGDQLVAEGRAAARAGPVTGNVVLLLVDTAQILDHFHLLRRNLCHIISLLVCFSAVFY